MSIPDEQDPIGDEACAKLRGGLQRTRQLAMEARQRLSEITSDTVYPGPAGLILAGTPTDALYRRVQADSDSPAAKSAARDVADLPVSLS